MARRMLKDCSLPCKLTEHIQLISSPCCSRCYLKNTPLNKPVPNLPNWSKNEPCAPLNEDECQECPNTCFSCCKELVKSSIYDRPSSSGSAMLYPKNYVTMIFNFGIEVDMSYEGAIRVKENVGKSFLATNADSQISALNHVCGQIYHVNNQTEIEVITAENNKYAIITDDYIKFKSSKSTISYVTDPTGTKSSADHLNTLEGIDYTKLVFRQALLKENDHKSKINHLIRSVRNGFESNVEIWEFENKVTIYKEKNFIRIKKYPNIEMKVSTNKKVSLYKDNIRMTASCDNFERHMFVRNKESRVHYNGSKFAVRYRAQNSGFDEEDEIFLS